MGLRPPEAFLQLLLGLLHELERLCAMTVVVEGGLLELFLRALEIARGGVDTWPPESCPLCRTGGQAVKPGSRA